MRIALMAALPAQLASDAAQLSNSARTQDALQLFLLNLEGHSRQAVLEVSSFLGVENAEQSVAGFPTFERVVALDLRLADIFFIPVADRDFEAPPDVVFPVGNHGETRQTHILDETAVIVFEFTAICSKIWF